MERSLVILKPDATKRKLLGELISRFEKKNMEITDAKMEVISRDIAEAHYSHVKHLPFYDDMIAYMTSSPSLIMVVKGEEAIRVIRSMIGKTNTFEAQQGTIRGDYGLHLFQNLIHASDSIESAEIEIQRFFGVQERER
ncbi:nucleoside-diphosphate kinase [Lacrimispora saccharolytica]|uniref:Nucleoside diphosphate kinase n=1 Tax=Lacrimispora saccharolytica (strain ATCC 35040 / DSM 2544 / NRCC 2533 / WM1) TaxID=610130 RepID=D9R7L8_LACSW|nr:nucleoside-diphosphate kinase [Lacrimispora saccharolytica]ADL03747.1 Nucleoside-diphosphate kinase [[Clostridium] saccharolyticum WM1]QRV18122.1 nucleoside-diphosphate kinase [Lacrimispora saccharolytica]